MAATGKAAGVNPEVWKIIDGKLFLYLNQAGKEKFAAKAESEISKANENWGKLNKE